MFKNYLIFFSFLLSTAYADQINEIVIDGNKRISDETIKVYGEIEINRDLSESDLNKIVKNLYSTNFLTMCLLK